jgi:hypothetical protein
MGAVMGIISGVKAECCGGVEQAAEKVDSLPRRNARG